MRGMEAGRRRKWWEEGEGQGTGATHIMGGVKGGEARLASVWVNTEKRRVGE